MRIVSGHTPSDQLVWAVSLSVGCCRLYPLSAFMPINITVRQSNIMPLVHEAVGSKNHLSSFTLYQDCSFKTCVRTWHANFDTLVLRTCKLTIGHNTINC